MTDEMKPVRCGCGGEAEVDKVEIDWCNGTIEQRWFVYCEKCRIETGGVIHRKAEAVEAWNRAMGERTAKVRDLERRSETSMSWEGKCSNCGAYTNHEMNYCFECGCRLIWGDD